MGNMSYCRFENTARDLEDCVDALYNEEKIDSHYERNGLQRILDLAKDIVFNEDYINEILEDNE